MTEEANAAIAGAFDAAGTKVVVSDSHGDMGNLLPHKLDQRAELVQGTPKVPFSMMTGIEEGFAAPHSSATTPAPARPTRSWPTRTPASSPTCGSTVSPGTRPT